MKVSTNHLEKARRRTLIVIALILIGVGLALSIYREAVAMSLFSLWGIVLVALSVFDLLKLPISAFRQKDQRLIVSAFRSLVQLAAGIFFFTNAFFPVVTVAWLTSLYLFLMGILYLFNFILIKNDGVNGYYRVLIDAIIHLLFGFTAVMNISSSANLVYLILGIYLIFLGLTYLRDGLEVMSTPNLQKARRRIRVSLPIIFTALIPRRTLDSINEFLSQGQEEEDRKIQYFKAEGLNTKPDLEVWIHTARSGFEMFGHVDISFKGMTYSYGHYDVDSSKLFGTIGDGTLWEVETSNYVKWIESRETRSVFRYGLVLTDQQSQAVEKQINLIKEDTKPFQLTSQTQKESYLGQMAALYPVKIYKFTRSRFKTYFVLTTNCVLLADTIIGKTGIDIVDAAGIITPGAYQSYFDKEFQRPYSNVITRSAIVDGKLELETSEI